MIDFTELCNEVLHLINKANALEELEKIRLFYLGKKGIFKQLERILFNRCGGGSE